MGSRKKGDAYRDLSHAGRRPDTDFAESLLKILAVGVAGGLATILGAKKVGEEIQKSQVKSARRNEEQREADKEAVRRTIEYDVDIE